MTNLRKQIEEAGIEITEQPSGFILTWHGKHDTTIQASGPTLVVNDLKSEQVLTPMLSS